MDKDIVYFLASPEAVILIEAFFAEMDAYKAAYRAFGESIGATNTIVLGHRVVGFEFRNTSPPKGWKVPAKKRKFPLFAAVGPTGWDAGLPVMPNKSKLDQALGIGPVEQHIWAENGGLHSGPSEYGYEKVGSDFVISARVVDGKMHGNPPTGCLSLKKSEYFALKGE